MSETSVLCGDVGSREGPQAVHGDLVSYWAGPWLVRLPAALPGLAQPWFSLPRNV